MGFRFLPAMADVWTADDLDEMRRRLDDLPRCDYDGCDDGAQIEVTTIDFDEGTSNLTGDVYCSRRHAAADRGWRY